MRKVNLLAIAVLASLAIVAMPVAAYATGNVTFQDFAKGFVFEPGTNESPTDLFPTFKDVVPGDTITDTVEVKSDYDGAVKIYLRALGAEEHTEAFLSQMNLKVAVKDGNALFDAAADQKAGLEDWQLIGTLQKGGNAILNVELTVPVTMGNEYQDALGTLVWEFRADEVVEPDPKPEPDPKKDTTPSSTPKSHTSNAARAATTAKTADGNPVVPLAAIAGASALLLAGAWAYGRREKQES